MPMYEYEADDTSKGCPHCQTRFDVFQSFTDAALEVCPECGGRVRRVFSAPSIHGAGRSADVLSNKNLAEKGFTKYVKAGDGHYEKAVGKGPDTITR